MVSYFSRGRAKISDFTEEGFVLAHGLVGPAVWWGSRGCRTVRWLVNLQPPSGSRKSWMLAISSFSPFCSVWGSCPLDGASHIQGESPPPQLNLSGNTPIDTPGGCSEGVSMVIVNSVNLTMKINPHPRVGAVRGKQRLCLRRPPHLSVHLSTKAHTTWNA